MEYSEVFHVTRQMHMRSYGEIVEFVENTVKKCRKLEIIIQNLNSGKVSSADSIFDMIISHVGEKNSDIKIIAKAKFSEEPLKKYVQEIGRLFTLDAGAD